MRIPTTTGSLRKQTHVVRSLRVLSSLSMEECKLRLLGRSTVGYLTSKRTSLSRNNSISGDLTGHKLRIDLDSPEQCHSLIGEMSPNGVGAQTDLALTFDTKRPVVVVAEFCFWAIALAIF